MVELKETAAKELVAESGRTASRRSWRRLRGPIRVAQRLPAVVTPNRFRTRRQFWAYRGLAIVVQSSSDWVRAEGTPRRRR